MRAGHILFVGDFGGGLCWEMVWMCIRSFFLFLFSGKETQRRMKDTRISAIFIISSVLRSTAALENFGMPPFRMRLALVKSKYT